MLSSVAAAAAAPCVAGRRAPRVATQSDALAAGWRPAARRAGPAAPRPAAATRAMAASVEIPAKYKQVTPMGDKVLIKVAEAETATTGGVLLPDSAVKKPTAGVVVSVGGGNVGGHKKAMALKAGDSVLYNRFGIGATDLMLSGHAHVIIREDDIMGTMPVAAATAADVPRLRPTGDRVLVKVTPVPSQTAGGLLIPEAAAERPLLGTVVAIGPGREDPESKDGVIVPPKIKVGDSVVYFKYAGDKLQTPAGEDYLVLHEYDVMGVLPQ